MQVDRRASVDRSHRAGGEVPLALNKIVLLPSGSEPINLPYDLHGASKEDSHVVAPELPHAQDGLSLVDLTCARPNGLAHIDLSSLSAEGKQLSKLCRSGFASDQRRDVWPRLLVLPSTVVQVDDAAYYRSIESVWHMPAGRLTHLLPNEETEDAELPQRAATLKQRLPTVFPEPPCLGRSTPFDWFTAIHHGEDDVLSQKRILCVLCANHALAFAPQLPALVSIVFHVLDRNESHAYAFVAAMLDRSKSDEHFLLMSPVSMSIAMIGFRRALQRHLPQIEAYISQVDFDVTTWFQSHLIDSFLASIPVEAVLRVCDTAITSGLVSTMIKFVVTLLARLETYLLSGAGGATELTDKLAKMMRVINVTSLFGQTMPHGLGWSSDTALYSKSDLAKLTMPTRDTTVVLHEAVTNTGAFNKQLEARRYHVPVIEAAGVPPMVESPAMDRYLCYQLYSGPLPPPACALDPVCIYSTSREGHSLSGLMSTLAEFRLSSSTNGSCTGVLLMLQTSAPLRHRVGVFFDQFPSPSAIRADSPSYEYKYDDDHQARHSRHGLRAGEMKGGGFLIHFQGATHTLKPFKVSPAAPPPYALSTQSDEGALASSLSNSLPILPIEGGPDSSPPRRQSRRSSLAIFLDALHIKRADEECPNSAAALKLISTVPPLSPFRHDVRIVDSPTASDVTEGDKSLAPATEEQTPLLLAQSSTTSTRSSSAASSSPTSPRRQSSLHSAESTPPMTRRQSFVAGLERVWSFIDSVPVQPQRVDITPRGTISSAKTSPVVSRRASVTGRPIVAVTEAPSPALAHSTQPSTTVFFPHGTSSAPTSVAGTPTRTTRTMPGQVKVRVSPPMQDSPSRTSSEHQSRVSSSQSNSPRSMVLRSRLRSMTMPDQNGSSPVKLSDQDAASFRRHSSVPLSARRTTSDVAGFGTTAEVREKQANADGHSMDTHPPVLEHSASAAYLRSLAGPEEAIRLDDHAASESARFRRTSSLSTTASTDSSQRSSPIEKDASETTQVHESSLLRAPFSSHSPSATPSPPPSFVSTSAAFRAQHPFQLAIDDADANARPYDLRTHAQIVRDAIKQVREGLQESDAGDAASRGDEDRSKEEDESVTVLMADSAFILLAPTGRLLFSLDNTLESGVCRAEEIDLSTGEDAIIEWASVEAWTFQ